MAQKHFFDPRVADRFGLAAAVLFERMEFWIRKYTEEKNHSHFRAGSYWFYATAEDWHTTFPYLTVNQIRYALNKLYESGMIDRTDRFNRYRGDRTLWYTITDAGMAMICENGEMNIHTSSSENSQLGVRKSRVRDKNSPPAIPEKSTEKSTNKTPDIMLRQQEYQQRLEGLPVEVNGVPLILPTNNSGGYEIGSEDLEHWEKLYPGADVSAELLRMIGWLESHPAKRKSRAGMPAFITHWLGNTHKNKNLSETNVKVQERRYDDENHFYAW